MRARSISAYVLLFAVSSLVAACTAPDPTKPKAPSPPGSAAEGPEEGSSATIEPAPGAGATTQTEVGITCADFGGTCLDGSSADPSPECADGTLPVVEGIACGTFGTCCVPKKASGSKEVHGTYGLLCTAERFEGFAGGSCSDGGGTESPCDVGCSCMESASGPTCDCSRGLPVTTPEAVECAVFDCGTISCGVGCTCTDPGASACSCP